MQIVKFAIVMVANKKKVEILIDDKTFNNFFILNVFGNINKLNANNPQLKKRKVNEDNLIPKLIKPMKIEYATKVTLLELSLLIIESEIK